MKRRFPAIAFCRGFRPVTRL